MRLVYPVLSKILPGRYHEVRNANDRSDYLCSYSLCSVMFVLHMREKITDGMMTGDQWESSTRHAHQRGT